MSGVEGDAKVSDLSKLKDGVAIYWAEEDSRRYRAGREDKRFHFGHETSYVSVRYPGELGCARLLVEC